MSGSTSQLQEKIKYYETPSFLGKLIFFIDFLLIKWCLKRVWLKHVGNIAKPIS